MSTKRVIDRGSLAKRIRKIRGELTLIEFGKKIGVAHSSVKRYEQGTLPDIDVLLRIARFAKMDLGKLLTGKPLPSDVRDCRPIKFQVYPARSYEAKGGAKKEAPGKYVGRVTHYFGKAGEATIIVMAQDSGEPGPLPGWVFRDQAFLSQDLADMIRMKNVSGSIIYAVLLSLALLAIFDTQVLAIFRRRREIGTLIALGMTRGAVIRLFTLEGAMHGILAALVAAAYGIPLLSIQAVRGFAMPEAVDSFGLAIAEKIFPVYSAGLVAGTTLIVLVAVAIVSFMPARRIARLNPTDAIKGKLS